MADEGGDAAPAAPAEETPAAEATPADGEAAPAAEPDPQRGDAAPAVPPAQQASAPQATKGQRPRGPRRRRPGCHPSVVRSLGPYGLTEADFIGGALPLRPPQGAAVGQRRPEPKTLHTPGPGTYSLSAGSPRPGTGPRFVRPLRRPVSPPWLCPTTTVSPGPCAYCPAPPAGRAVSMRFRPPHFSATPRADPRYPAPGEYSPSAWRPSGPRYTMTARNIPPNPIGRNPGPGAYDPTPPLRATVPGALLRGRIPPQRTDQTAFPGPGAYDQPDLGRTRKNVARGISMKGRLPWLLYTGPPMGHHQGGLGRGPGPQPFTR
eukprot:TRINITY_DN10409_c0_g2_i1.p2 TRINITY_DN10409_c0_g2~~TRINITY_DN10409_c0_g2_i1.p2  ORF type:complete len:319 (+),score=28.71 TRINITY_DN10409_c0_g2_i1:91-1047(+)